MKTSLNFACLALISASGLLAAASERAVPRPAAGDALAAPAVEDRELLCDGKTKGFWTNPNGEELIESGHFLSILPSLHVVDENGAPFAPTNFEDYKEWMQAADSFNMAYMLSAQLVAMQFNVLAGNVSQRCEIHIQHGTMTIARLIEQSIDALIQDPYTPPGDPNRPRQEALKNLLDAANNNLNWD